MDFAIYREHLADAMQKKKLLMALVAVLVTLVVLLAACIVYQAERTRIVIVPTHLAGKIELEGENVSPDYVRVMILHMTGLLYTYTPHNAAARYREFLAYIPSNRLEEVKNSLQRKIDQISRLKISESFMAREFHILGPTACVIAGSTIRWSAGQELTKEDINIKYVFSVKNGGFQIEEIINLSPAEYTALLRAPGK